MEKMSMTRFSAAMGFGWLLCMGLYGLASVAWADRAVGVHTPLQGGAFRIAQAGSMPVVPPEPDEVGRGAGSGATTPESRGREIARLKSLVGEISRLRSRIKTETKRIEQTKEKDLARVEEVHRTGLAAIKPKDMFETTREYRERQAREKEALEQTRKRDVGEVNRKSVGALNSKVKPLEQRLGELLGETVIVTVDAVEIEGYDADVEVFHGRVELESISSAVGIGEEEKFSLLMARREARTFWENRERLVGRVRLSLDPRTLEVKISRFWLDDPGSGSGRWEIPLIGTGFRDCVECPEMVVIPAGGSMMGSPAGEEGGAIDERPMHRVTIVAPFAVGKYEVTFEEWEACVAGGGCGGYRPYDGGWGRGRRPVMNVSWEDAKGYVEWLSRKTGKEYRLLSEAEWEYAARAGTTVPFHSGATISTDQANYDGDYSYGSGRKGVYRKWTIQVGSFPANRFGLHDMHGNVREWVEDCWHPNYDGAPTDGSAWTSGGHCNRRVSRGGSWEDSPTLLRSAYRFSTEAGTRNDAYGFRVARTLAR